MSKPTQASRATQTQWNQVRFRLKFSTIQLILIALIALISATVAGYAGAQHASADPDLELIKWRLNYSGEYEHNYQRILVHDNFVDERLVNIITLVKAANFLNFDFSKIDSGDKQLDYENEQSTIGPEVNDKLCAIHLEEMSRQFDEMSSILSEKRRNGSSGKTLSERHIRLANVLDSFGRYESGTLLGRTYMIGSGQQCYESQLMLDQKNPLNLTPARLCWARLGLDRSLPGVFKRANPADSSLDVAVCIPETCHNRSLKKHKSLLEKLLNSQFKLPPSIYLQDKLEITNLFCALEPHKSRLSMSGKLLLSLLFGWCGLLVFATIRGSRTKDSENADDKGSIHIFKSLNVFSSWNDFVSSSQEFKDSRVSLNSVGVIKCLGCFMVIFGHSVMTNQAFSFDTIRNMSKVEYGSIIYIALAGTAMIDTFFLLTSMILTYIFLKKLNVSKMANFNWIQSLKWCLSLSITRYLRLLPMYYLVFWFKKSILLDMVVSPQSDIGFNKETANGNCRIQSWFDPVLARAAFVPLSKQCLPHTWSVAVDLIFSLLAGPFIVVLLRRFKIGLALAFIGSIGSGLLMYRDSMSVPEPYLTELRELKGTGVTYLFRNSSHIYSMPQYRLFSLFIGITAGYILYRYDAGDRKNTWPRWLTGIATYVSIFLVVFTIASTLGMGLMKSTILKQYPIQRIILIPLMTFGRIFWSLSNAILILRLMTDWKDTAFGKFSSCGLMQSLSKLNYIILLIHVDVMADFFENRTSVGSFTAHDSVNLSFSTFMVCCILAIPGFVLLENPIQKVMKQFTKLLEHRSGGGKKLDAQGCGENNGTRQKLE